MTYLMEVVPFSTTDVQTALAPIIESFTFSNLAPMIAIALTAGVGLVLGWFGVNYIKGKVQKALKKGRV